MTTYTWLGQFPVENTCKNPQENISKLNSIILHQKDHTLWSTEIYSRDARTVQNPQINEHVISPE